MNFLVRLIISTLSILIAAYILPGIHIDNFITAVLVAVVIGCLNILLKPILILFSLPAVIFSFGLFLLVINTFIILLADKLVNGFSVDGFWMALLFSMVTWMSSGIMNAIKRKDEQAY